VTEDESNDEKYGTEVGSCVKGSQIGLRKAVSHVVRLRLIVLQELIKLIIVAAVIERNVKVDVKTRAVVYSMADDALDVAV